MGQASLRNQKHLALLVTVRAQCVTHAEKLWMSRDKTCAVLVTKTLITDMSARTDFWVKIERPTYEWTKVQAVTSDEALSEVESRLPEGARVVEVSCVDPDPDAQD